MSTHCDSGPATVTLNKDYRKKDWGKKKKRKKWKRSKVPHAPKSAPGPFCNANRECGHAPGLKRATIRLGGAGARGPAHGADPGPRATARHTPHGRPRDPAPHTPARESRRPGFTCTQRQVPPRPSRASDLLFLPLPTGSAPPEEWARAGGTAPRGPRPAPRPALAAASGRVGREGGRRQLRSARPRAPALPAPRAAALRPGRGRRAPTFGRLAQRSRAAGWRAAPPPPRAVAPPPSPSRGPRRFAGAAPGWHPAAR